LARLNGILFLIKIRDFVRLILWLDQTLVLWLVYCFGHHSSTLGPRVSTYGVSDTYTTTTTDVTIMLSMRWLAVIPQLCNSKLFVILNLFSIIYRYICMYVCIKNILFKNSVKEIIRIGIKTNSLFFIIIF